MQFGNNSNSLHSTKKKTKTNICNINRNEWRNRREKRMWKKWKTRSIHKKLLFFKWLLVPPSANLTTAPDLPPLSLIPLSLVLFLSFSSSFRVYVFGEWNSFRLCALISFKVIQLISVDDPNRAYETDVLWMNAELPLRFCLEHTYYYEKIIGFGWIGRWNTIQNTGHTRDILEFEEFYKQISINHFVSACEKW